MRRFAPLLAFPATLLSLSCGGSGTSTQPPPNPGTLVLTVPVPVATLSPGGTGSLVVVVIRGGGFAGPVNVSVTGLPAGVTGSFSPSPIDAASSTSTLALTASPTATVGTATVTVTASGTGVATQSATAQVIVTQPSITLGASALSVGAGASGVTTVTIGRSAGFTGSVSLTLQAPPAGITGTFNASPTTQNTSSLTVAVASSVMPGNYPLVIRGTATGALDGTVTLALTVTAALPTGFTASVDPVEFELPAGRGWNTSGVAVIQRAAGFTGPVSVSVQGTSLAAFIGLTPSTIAAGQSMSNMLALTIDGAAPGVYNFVVRFQATGFAEQQVPVRVRISPPSTGSITWNFCQGFRVPRYMAVRDGTGPWRHIVADGPWGATTATPAKFSFDIASATASVALVWLGEKTSGNNITEGFHWNVFYMTRQEIADMAAAECVENRETTSRTVSASVTGYQSFDALIASISKRANAGVGSTGPLTTTMSGQNIAPGPFDLLLSRTAFVQGTGPDISVRSIVLRRNIDPASGATLPAIDFATEGFSPQTGVLTVGNTNNESFTHSQVFRTTNGLYGWLAAAALNTPGTRTWHGVPAVRQQPGDLHQLITTTGSTTARRQIITFAKDVADRTITFGPPLNAPQVAPNFAPLVGTLNFAGILQTEYASRVSAYFRETMADPRTMVVMATRGFLGGSTQYNVSTPDLTGLSGYTQFWNFRRGGTVAWTVTGGEGGTGDPLTDLFCTLNGWCPTIRAVDGAQYKSAQAKGTVGVPF